MQVGSATMACLSVGLLGSHCFESQSKIIKVAPCNVQKNRQKLLRLRQPLSVECRITNQEADQLVRNAILQQPLENRAELFARVKSPDDIYRSGVSTVRLLKTINTGVSDEITRENNLKALFLRDKLGQYVVNETLKTWRDKLDCLLGILLELPNEISRKRVPLATIEQNTVPLSNREAKQLAESFLLKKPLKNRQTLLEKIIIFDDMVKVDGEANKLLLLMNEGLSEADARKNTLKYLFLMHHVGVQLTRLMIQTSREHRMYRQHLLEVMKPW